MHSDDVVLRVLLMPSVAVFKSYLRFLLITLPSPVFNQAIPTPLSQFQQVLLDADPWIWSLSPAARTHAR